MSNNEIRGGAGRGSSGVLTASPVAGTLFRMAYPMLAGSMAMQAFNLADTWFVAKLGTLPLAAIGFSFPVVMLIGGLVRGLGTGSTAMVAQALGQGDHERARRVATHTLILTLLLVLILSTLGILTIGPLFRALGAHEEVLPMVRDYMIIWYAGVIFMFLPMVVSDTIRATGDTIRPSMVMLLSAVLNIALDPIMIFGWWCFPALGIRGAALAGTLARVFTSLLALWILHRRHGLLLLERPRLASLWESWRGVMAIGIPSTLSNLLDPISAAIITRIIASHGPEAVAAASAGGRLEMFAFMIPMCLGMSLVPFVGQNFGAQRLDRVREARRLSMVFAGVFGLLTFVLFVVGAPYLAQLFSDDPKVIEILTFYLRVLGLGHGMLEVHRYAGFFLNGVHRPMHAMGVNVVRIVVLLVPFAVVGGLCFGLYGVFTGRMLSDLASGALGIWWSGHVLHQLEPAASASERRG